MNQPKQSDLKTFALIWSFIFLIVGLLPLLHGNTVRLWAIIVMLIFLIIAFSRPSILSSFYKIWVKIGGFIGAIMSRVIMALLFYAMFTPIALILKLLGKDLLGKKLDKSSPSYWIKRDAQPGSLKNQF